MRWFIAILFCLFAACRHPAYTLARRGRSQILTPPPSKPEIKNARRHPAQKTGCDIESESFSLAWRGNTARVTVKPEIYYAPPVSPVPQPGTPGISIAESGPRMYSDSLAQIEKFRDAVASREDAGCLRDEESARLRQAITEMFAFPPQIAAYLRFGTYTQTGSIDLIPGFLLRLVTPAGADPDVSFYSVLPPEKTASKGGCRLDSQPYKTDCVTGSVRIVLTSGAGKSLTVPETTAYFRYLYWTGASAHNFRTTILGAPDRNTLHDATGQFLSDPEGFCGKSPAGVFCQSIPANVGMNVGFNVRVNGGDVFVRMGGTIGEALGEARNGLRPMDRRQTLPTNVTVRRTFHGRSIPIKVDGQANDIFGLVAMPGDEITF
jgi:hypothetical protein